MTPFIKGEKIFLRAIALDDATETYLSWLNDEETTKGLASGLYPTSIDQLRSFIESVIRDKNAVMFAICDMDTQNHIGNIKIDRFDWVSRTCELGLLIGDKNYWGKGIGYEACKLTAQYAFNDLNMRKILLAVYENNPAAIHLYKKLGFVMEGTLRKHVYEGGNYYDKYFMGLFAEELR